jgi:hypothetical protein
MRDIRADLRERLRLLEARRAELQITLKDLDEETAAIMRMLDAEDRRFPPVPDNGQAMPEKILTEFIYEELVRRRMSKKEIRVVVEGAGYKVDGRSVHLTLVNLERNGRIQVADDQRYQAMSTH